MRHRWLFWFRTIAIAAILAASSALLLLSVPVEARNKTGDKFRLLNLKSRPTNAQKLEFAFTHCDYDYPKYKEILKTIPLTGKFVSFGDYCAEQKRENFDSEIVESNGSFLVSAQILLHQGSRELDVLLGVKNYKDSPPIELLPQKVFLVDDHGQAHSAVTEYAAKAAIASEHQLPQFAPPPPETYYTITQVPRDSRVPILPPDPSQPQFTIYESQVTPHVDHSHQVGYEISYLLGAWLNKRDAKKQLKWIDENWFHRKRLAPGEVQSGYLLFENVLETPFIVTSAQNPGNRVDDAPKVPSQSPTSPSQGDWVDDILNAPEPQRDGSVKLVIFIEDEQFIFKFGPEVVDWKSN